MSKLFAKLSFSSMNAALAGGSMLPVILICLLVELVPLIAQQAAKLCKIERSCAQDLACRERSNLSGTGIETGTAEEFTSSR